MASQIDLGRCLFRDASSSIQLRLAAAASVSPQLNQLRSFIPVDTSQGLHTTSDWIVEGPGLEMRFIISVERSLETAATALVSSLGEKLSSSHVWPYLGFAMVFKACDRRMDKPGSYCLTFGLYREPRPPSASSRNLPAVMRNLPDAHAPIGTRTIVLSAIDIFLEYGMAERVCHQQPTQSASPTNIPFHNQNSGYSQADQFGLFPSHVVPYSILGYENDSQTPLHSMFHLLESGLQRFIFSSAGRCPGIKIVDRNKLQSLSKFAPAVFLTGYREAMNQRAISIPIITRALASMLENNESATIQSRLQIFMQGRGQDDTALSSDLTPANLRSNIQSSLWRMAQTQLSTTRPKKPPLFLFSESKREQITPTVDSTVQNAISPDHPIEDDDLDSYLGSEDNFEVNLMLQSEIEDSELLELEEAMLLSINSDSSFKDISESTQTTVEFPLLPCSSFTASSRDAEMLFADDD